MNELYLSLKIDNTNNIIGQPKLIVKLLLLIHDEPD